MKGGKSAAVAFGGKGASVPSEQEKKLVAELEVIRRQAERQMRECDRVMAEETKKSSRGE